MGFALALPGEVIHAQQLIAERKQLLDGLVGRWVGGEERRKGKGGGGVSTDGKRGR